MSSKHLNYPPIDTSDDNTILIKSYFNQPQNHDNSSLFKRDFRDSNLRYLVSGLLLLISISDCEEKYEKFDEIISSMIEYYFRVKKTKICKSDKLWMTPSVKIAIVKRQKAFHRYGKNSECISSCTTKSNVMSKVREISSTENQLRCLMGVTIEMVL